MRVGGEVGEEEAALVARGATASVLAQAGFDGKSSFRTRRRKLMIGADQGAMDLLSRMVVERLSNLGKTFRLLIDGFSHKMSSEVCPLSHSHLPSSPPASIWLWKAPALS